MSKCTKCGDEKVAGVCHSCLRNWIDMRTVIFNKLTEKYGTLSPTNHELFKKQTKRLENIWRKDKEKFVKEIENF